MRGFCLAISLVTIALMAMAAEPMRAQGRRDIDVTNIGVVYKVEGTDQVRVTTDLRFPSNGAELKYDMYAPSTPGDARPAIIFVSGASEVRHWRWFKDYGRLAAAHGFVGFVPDKRYPPGFAGTQSATADTKAFIEHLVGNTGKLGIDSKRLCLWVFSAGGRVTALPFHSDAPEVRCLVAYYGVMSVRDQVPDGGNAAASLARYSPEQAVAAPGARKVPTFIARAGKDVAPINASIRGFVDAAVGADVPLTFVNYPAGEHGFDGLNDTDESRRIVARSFAFVAEQVGN